MKLLYSQIIGLPIGSLEEKSKVGTIKRVVIDPTDACVAGFVVSSNYLSVKKLVVSWRDVTEIEPKALIIRSQECIVSLEEILRIKNIINSGFTLIDISVISTNNLKLGRVYDFNIDSETGALVNIYVKKFLGKKRIISRSRIIRIATHTITVRADNTKVLPLVRLAKTSRAMML